MNDGPNVETDSRAESIPPATRGPGSVPASARPGRSIPRLKPLSRQVIVITGASSGIGLATARRAASEGAKVVLAARNEQALRKAVDGIRAKGGTAAFAVADVGDEAQVEAIVETAKREYGGFDTWVNNAGVGIYGRISQVPTDEHQRLFATNYFGVVHGCKAALEHLKDRPGGGALITVGSVNSEFALPLLGTYAATKHAVKALVDALRLEVMEAGHPVAVTLIKPSGIGTPFSQHARNHLDREPQVAEPVYAPDVVAQAILHAAQWRTREITVGGSGRLLTMLAQRAPWLSDQLLAAAGPSAQQTDRPARSGDGLFQPGSDGRVHREGASGGRSFSLYTTAQTNPLVGAALMLGGMWLARSMFGPLQRGQARRRRY